MEQVTLAGATMGTSHSVSAPVGPNQRWSPHALDFLKVYEQSPRTKFKSRAH
jgi:hypothetical protein